MKVLKIGFLVIFISLGCLLSGCGRAMIHMYQGDKYWGQGKYEDAIAAFQQAIEIDSNSDSAALAHYRQGESKGS